MEQSNEAKLRAVIAAAIAEDDSRSDREIAAFVSSEAAELVAAWAVETPLASLVRRLRPKPADPLQGVFAFVDLSTHIPLKEGKKPIGQATIGLLRQSEKLLMKRHKNAKPRANSLLGKIQREIELMEPWAYENRRITVQQTHDLIAGGATPAPVVNRSKMSDAMRRYWAHKTPEERSAIMRRRFAKKALKKGKGTK